MKILWISHDPVREPNEFGQSSSGFWKEALLKLLIDNSGISIKVAFPGKKCSKTHSGNYTFRFTRKKIYNDLPLRTKNDLLYIINQYKPDLIHVHGTEKPYGLIVKYIKIPVLISLQGFLTESYNSLIANIALPIWKEKKTLKEIIFRNSFINLHSYWFYNAQYERQIVRLNKYFAGRTQFDEEFVLKYNSLAKYFRANETLREDFYDCGWNIGQIERHSIYISSFTNPLKGFHILLGAASFLVKEFRNLNILVPGRMTKKMVNQVFGNSYYRILKEMIEDFGLNNNITFLGALNGKEVSKILKKTHVFVLPSFIENSSNALGEAQVVGVPSIVSSECGGTESIIEENVNGLIFKKGNAFDLANKIRKIFLTDNLAMQLSENSKQFGFKFHNRETIKKQYYSIYKTIIKK